MNENLCANCVSSIWCGTWAEWKCLVTKTRHDGGIVVDECDSYTKRGNNFKDRKCMCEDCLNSGRYSEEE